MKYNLVEKLPLTDRTVFLRLDLNVPINESGEITDTTRIDYALPTLKYILKFTNKIVIASHLGRPKSKSDSKYSLEPVGRKLSELLNIEVAFVKDYVEAPCDQLLQQLGKNRIILLENLRFFSQETENQKGFAQTLAKGIDFYVNDAFGTMHRAHASVAALAERFPKERKAMGYLVREELKALDQLREQAQTPFTLIIGGAKVSDKVGILLKLIDSCNHILIGGAMAYSFLKFEGKSVGRSLCESNVDTLIQSIHNNALARKVSIMLPEDHICAESLNATETTLVEGEIPEHLMGLDIGPKTIEKYKRVIFSSKTIFWNGPLGVFERLPFRNGTLAIAKAIAERHCFSVAGGGDSVAAINIAGVADQFSHISTGGGASLEYLEGKPLPGLKALL